MSGFSAAPSPRSAWRRDETVVVESVGLASSPAAVIGICALWVCAGLIVAASMHRRGHDHRAMRTLGIALGPLMIGLSGTLRHSRSVARPIVLHEPDYPIRSGQRVMITVSDDPTLVADALSVLGQLSPPPTVDLVTRINIDAAAADRSRWSAHTKGAAQNLNHAAAFLGAHQPRLMMIPGPPTSALADHAATNDYDIVVTTGSSNERSRFVTAHSRRGVPPITVSIGSPRPIVPSPMSSEG